ncbi:hypothetical protein F5B21DRAFT_504483 [Xylaria acuta]|nr:hypothetical protein F5B21DRAFT_504483 [Xylaria acuta]
MASVIFGKDRHAIVDVLTTSRYQPHTTTADSGLAMVTRPYRSPSPNSKERLQRLQAACEMLSDLAKRRQSVVSIAIKPNTPPTERREYSRITAGTASRQVGKSLRAQTLEKLQAQWLGQERDIFEIERKMRRLEADIIRLQVEDAIEGCDVTKHTNYRWWDKVLSFVFGVTSRRSKDSMAKRERGLNRKYSIRVKKEQMLTGTNKLSALETAMQITETAIEELGQEMQVEERGEEAGGATRAEWEYEEHEEQPEKTDGSCEGLVDGNIEVRRRRTDQRVSASVGEGGTRSLAASSVYAPRLWGGPPYSALTAI